MTRRKEMKRESPGLAYGEFGTHSHEAGAVMIHVLRGFILEKPAELATVPLVGVMLPYVARWGVL